jgi:hypothetical protein
MTYGFVGLKFLLNILHRQIIDLCEHEVSCSAFAYTAASMTPVEFHAISDTIRLSLRLSLILFVLVRLLVPLLISRFYKV